VELLTEEARAAAAALSVAMDIREAESSVPNRPGLYAIHAEPTTLREIGIDHIDGPLYVGKAERSLRGRDLRTHFATDPDRPARTGGSTVRRSFAALLADRLSLTPVPRDLPNPNPAYAASFALSPDDDERLTGWMHEHLRLAVWPSAHGVSAAQLGTIESELIVFWRPPINLRDNPAKSALLRAARSRMTRIVRDRIRR
jgi:hypothetical protein